MVLGVEDAVDRADGGAGDDLKLHAAQVESMDDPGLEQAFRPAPGHDESAHRRLRLVTGHTRPPGRMIVAGEIMSILRKLAQSKCYCGSMDETRMNAD